MIRQLSEKASEFRLPLWVVAIDFQKAFDSFSHTALWSALQDQRVPNVYINALQRLYKKQTGAVFAGETSREFQILRGSRQGDPISPVLFNAVLEMIMRPCIEKWNARGWGWSFEDAVVNLTNLRFADDLLLTARSLFQARSMLEDVCQAAEQVGLSLHYGKTKVLHNGQGQDVKKTEVQVNTTTIEIVSSTDYLGTKLCLDERNAMDLEIDHRVARAWSKFSAFRSELTNKQTSLFDRLRLFHAVVTPCATYACGSWSLKRETEQKLRVAQRRMLRAILGKGRKQLEQEHDTPAKEDSESQEWEEGEGDIAEDEKHLEAWKDWLKRTTAEVRAAMQKLRIGDWVTLARKR